ncbi:Pimeloyl-ACP methyl ester carboxylesterase [Georgenia satyanarayanai]|uniref:Pimeloyl-ACP methyl ester carboxylesterase n=1 Tax=Georgenia satyanarayanai TaxID=860221 RepID=A0A2Y9AFB9_9MICO|nr:alpha/beta hydrolase [Georgenia satyanarayanai]PYF99342.1 pimeloyl-ACP methyl ester carboxylesterase [Georgenia satyanarayanai]SSA43154.1 Pimeloyl-ACP methyl ester carboxylesterase [Georgenia satyanarayanai]
MAHPVILVPGFWLGAWAWEDVLTELRRAGVEAQALTLPGLEHADTDRSGVTFEDHVEAVCAAVEATGRPTVLVVHSGAGFSGYAASDRLTDRLAGMVYVDTAPGVGPMDPGFDGADMPLDWESLAAEENLDGLSEEQLQTFRTRAVPQPGGVLRGAADLVDDARRHVPSTFVCTSFTAEAYRAYAAEGTMPWLAGIPELTDTTWVDLPTSHWPMWSRPRDLAAVIAEAAGADASTLT